MASIPGPGLAVSVTRACPGAECLPAMEKIINKLTKAILHSPCWKRENERQKEKDKESENQEEFYNFICIDIVEDFVW